MQDHVAEFERVAAENASAAQARAAEEEQLRETMRALDERNRDLEERIAALEQQTKAIQS